MKRSRENAVLHTGVGAISESDVILAEASGAPVIGFNVRANKTGRVDHAENSRHRDPVLLRDLRSASMTSKARSTGMLDPELRETFLGNAEILETFMVSREGGSKVAGCRVTDGIGSPRGESSSRPATTMS